MGINAEIFKWSLGDCSNKGISSKASAVCVVNADGPFDPNNDHPAVRLVKRKWGNVVAIPVGLDDTEVMFGGTYIASSDARFCRAVETLSGYDHSFPVALHDRVE